VRSGLRDEGESRAQDLLAEARKESDTKLEAARQKIEKSTEAARLALRTRADKIARSIASKLLGREV
jgi:F0F1-type ATP synthase membrane subunit b/b'